MISESARHRPPAGLRPLVAWYSGYREVGAPPARHRGLLGLPAGALATLDAEGDEVLGRFAAELQDQVRAAGTWAGRFAVLDRLLAARAGLTGAVPLGSPRPFSRPASFPRHTGPMDARHLIAPEVAYAWRTLLATRGAVSVAALAEETGWSARHLDNRFRAEIGLTPKAAARVIRFDRARRMLTRRVRDGRPPALADLAVAGGYYDQAHLAREFRGLAGCPPSRWLAEEFRNVQGAGPGGQEGSRS